MDPRPESYCLNQENAQRRRLRRKTNKIVNFPLERLSQPCKFFSPNPSPLLQISVDFVLRQEVQKPFLHLLHQSSEFYLRLQASCFFRTDFHFKLIKIVLVTNLSPVRGPTEIDWTSHVKTQKPSKFHLRVLNSWSYLYITSIKSCSEVKNFIFYIQKTIETS